MLGRAERVLDLGRPKGWVWLAGVLLLGGCASTSEPMVAQTPPPVQPSRDLLAEVRAAAADAGDVIEVRPLRDPGVEDLLERAERGSQSGKFKSADRALLRGLVHRCEVRPGGELGRSLP